MFFRKAKLGPAHLAEYNAADAVIHTKSGLPKLLDEPVVPVLLALAGGVFKFGGLV